MQRDLSRGFQGRTKYPIKTGRARIEPGRTLEVFEESMHIETVRASAAVLNARIRWA